MLGTTRLRYIRSVVIRIAHVTRGQHSGRAHEKDRRAEARVLWPIRRIRFSLQGERHIADPGWVVSQRHKAGRWMGKTSGSACPRSDVKRSSNKQGCVVFCEPLKCALKHGREGGGWKQNKKRGRRGTAASNAPAFCVNFVGAAKEEQQAAGGAAVNFFFKSWRENECLCG